MPADALLTLAAAQTQTGSGSGPALDLKTNPSTPRRGLKATVQFSAAANASGANNLYFQIDHSADNVNWFPLAFQIENQGAVQGLNLTTAPQSGELHLSFEGANRFIRLTRTFAGAGTGRNGHFQRGDCRRASLAPPGVRSPFLTQTLLCRRYLLHTGKSRCSRPASALFGAAFVEKANYG